MRPISLNFSRRPKPFKIDDFFSKQDVTIYFGKEKGIEQKLSSTPYAGKKFFVTMIDHNGGVTLLFKEPTKALNVEFPAGTRISFQKIW